MIGMCPLACLVRPVGPTGAGRATEDVLDEALPASAG
jgi:hypothetical protein